jgi:hypothetical protein
MDDEFYFTVDGNEWQQQSYYESEHHPTSKDVKFIRKIKFQARFCCGELSVKAALANQCFSKPVLQSTIVYQYFINVSKNTTKTNRVLA